MSRLVYETVEGAPGPILLDHTTDDDHVIVGVYGHAAMLSEACDCREDALCRHPGWFAHVTFTWLQVAPYEITIDFIEPTGRRVLWRVDRDLVRTGGGEGDVRVRRCGELADVGVSTARGSVTLRIEQGWLDLLIETTDEIVAPGAECVGLDWAQLLGGEG